MKNLLFLLLLSVGILLSCKSETSKQVPDNQLVKEITQLDSVNEDLENAIREIDQSEAELEAALEDLDYD